MPVQVHRLTENKIADWNRFVEGCDAATFFHKAEWMRVLQSAFGHKTHYCYAEENGDITGVLPLAELRSPLFGHHLVSTPFCVYGGVAAATDAARAALTENARRLAEELRVEDLELRNLHPQNPDWPTKSLYVTFRKEISADHDANLKSIPRKQRAMVRKGIEAGLSGHEVSGIDRFYRVYSESVRNLGTPVFPKRYFSTLRRIFGDDCQVLMIQHEGRDVAGVMSFYYRDQVLPYYAGSVHAARALKGNDYMYWDLMCRAVERGARIFDYGRSKVGTGPFSFKKNWGFEPEPLHYEYFLVKSNAVPSVDPTNPKYSQLINLWRRLPLPVANVVGPILSRNLG